MKLLTIGDYDGNLSLYEAQLKQFILMHQRGINVTIMGKFSDEIATLLANKNVPFVINKAHQKKDITFIKQLQSYVEENKIDIIHVFGGNNTSNTCIAFKKNKKVKIIGYMGSTSIHWHDPSAYKTYLNPRIDAIICNSKDNARHFKKQLFFNKNKVYSIYKGYDVSWFDGVLPADLSDLNISETAIVVTCVGHVRRVKAMDLFVKAIEHVEHIIEKDLHFLLVGKGTQDETMQNYKNKSLYSDRIHLLGHRTDIKSILKRSDIYVQTSIKEGLGRAITESMCLEKPIVVTNAGGCTELIKEGVNGYIAENKNVKSIAHKISLLSNSPQQREAFGKASIQRIHQIFNINSTVDQTLALYREILKN